MSALLSVGSQFAGYRIERVLGSGGMGTVYLGRGVDLPRSEAIKVLSPELSRNPDFRARFIREADVAAGLDHPNVVSVFGRGEFEDKLWIAMQFVDGTDADDALQAGLMTPARAVHLVAELAKALDYAHAHEVVHRDVKPANFLMSGQVGPEERVLLGDFGIARALDDAKLTATGSFMATVAYAAPEVLAGQPFDGRADLYSLGCTLFRLFTGQPPYPSQNGVAAVIAAHLTAPPPRVTDRAPGFSPRMDSVIARAMAKDPAERFSSAREFAEAAREALGESQTVALRPVPKDAVESYAPTTAGTQGPWLPQPGYTPPHPMPFHPPPARNRGPLLLLAASMVLAIVLVGVWAALFVQSRQSKPGSSPGAGHASSAPTSTTSATPKVSSAALLGLLLTPQQGTEIVGAPSMSVGYALTSIADDASTRIVEKDCVGPWEPAQRLVYAATGWTGAQVQVLVAAKGTGMNISQAVINFPSADLARRVVSDQAPQWSACSGRTVTLPPMEQSPPKTVHLTFGPLTQTNGMLTMSQSSQDWTANNEGCQHVVGSRAAIVIDVAVCRPDVGNEAVDAFNAIAAKIPQ